MINQLVDTVYDVIGVKSEIQRVPFPPTEKNMDVGDFIADNRKLREDTGWYPRVSFADGLHSTVNFYRERLQDNQREQ